jgi:hypothetical protein
MTIRMKQLVIRCTAIAACVLLCAVRAVATPGLNIWPSKVEVSVAAGAIKTGVIAVQNQGVSTRTLQVLVVNCRMNQDGSLAYLNEDDTYGCRTWIKASAQEITITPRANYQLLYSVKVPKNAAGSYIAAVLLADASRANLTPQEYQDLSGAIILVTVPKTGERAADLLGLSVHKNSDDAGYIADLLIQNRGNLALTPSGLVQVYAEDGAEKLSVPINEGKELVLPGATRKLGVPVERLDAGSYKMTATVDYGSLELLQGETTVFIQAGEIIYQKGGEKAPRGNQPAVNQPAGGEPAQPGKPAAGAKGGKAAKADIDGLIKLGTSLYSSGDYAKALGVWQRILKADPKNAAAKKNLERTKQKLKAQKSAKG